MNLSDGCRATVGFPASDNQATARRADLDGDTREGVHDGRHGLFQVLRVDIRERRHRSHTPAIVLDRSALAADAPAQVIRLFTPGIGDDRSVGIAAGTVAIMLDQKALPWLTSRQ